MDVDVWVKRAGGAWDRAKRVAGSAASAQRVGFVLTSSSPGGSGRGGGPHRIGRNGSSQVGGLRQDELASGGQVWDCGQHARPTAARRGAAALDVRRRAPTGVPLVDLLSAGLLVLHRWRRSACRPGSGTEAPAQRLVQGLVQRGRLRGEHVDGLVLVPVGGGLGDPGAWPSGGCPAGPETRPARRPPASSRSGHASRPGCRSPGGALPAAATRTGPVERDVKGDTIGDHAEPPGTGRDLGRDLLYRGLSAIKGIFSYARV